MWSQKLSCGKFFQIICVLYERKLMSFLNLKTIQTTYVTPSITGYERNKFSKLSLIKTQISINHVRRETELPSYSLYGKYFPPNYKILVLCKGDQSEQPENTGENILQKCVRKSPQMLLFWILHCIVSFLAFVICHDFFSHYFNLLLFLFLNS